MLETYDLRQLRDEGVDLEETLDAQWLDEELNDGARPGEPALTAVGDGTVKLHLRRTHNQPDGRPVVRVTGSVAVDLTSECVRCQAAIALPIRPSLDLTFFPASAPKAPKDEDDAPQAQGKKKKKKKKEPIQIDLSEAELDEGTYLEWSLDLPDAVREAILLSMDMNLRCSDVGECTQRTEKLLRDAGVVSDEPEIDPRWEALKKIRLKTS